MIRSTFAIALAAAAAAVPLAASAQASQVQIYGRVDLSANLQEIGSRPRYTAVSSDTSLIGFRGTEDLGGGLAAYFKMESGFNADSGAQASPTTYWNREIYVGLRSASLGAIELGTHWTPAIWLTGRTDPFGRSQLGAQFTLLQGSAARGYGTQFANSIEYLTPVYAGFQGRLLYQAPEGTPSHNHALGLDYSSGKFYAGLAYDSTEVAGPTVGLPAGGTSKVKNLGIGSTYDFGMVKLFGYVQRNQVKNLPDVTGFDVGAAVRVGAGEIRTSYAQTNRTGAKASLIALGYNYFLSKRTTVYTTIAYLDNRDAARFSMWPASQDLGAANAPAAGDNVRGFQVGVRHTF